MAEAMQTTNQETDPRNLNMEGKQEEELRKKHECYEEEEESPRKCRICFAEEGEEGTETLGPLMTVCPCKGSSKYVHHNCLVNWFTSSGKRTCTHCKLPVEYTEKLKPIRQWTWEPVDSIEILVYAILLLVFFIFSVIVNDVCSLLELNFVTGLAMLFSIYVALISIFAMSQKGRRVLKRVLGISLGYWIRHFSMNRHIVLKPYNKK